MTPQSHWYRQRRCLPRGYDPVSPDANPVCRPLQDGSRDPFLTLFRQERAKHLREAQARSPE